jgi:hypothetical protein
MTAHRSTVAAALVLSAAIVSVRAQKPQPPLDPPGAPASQAPAAQAADKPDLSGTWQLDRGISTDLATLSFEPRANADNPRGSMGRGGYGGGYGGRGGGFGGYGGRNAPRQPARTSSPEEQARLKMLTDDIKAGSATLVISHHEPTFTVSDAQGKTRFLKTDGGTDKNQLGAATIESTTHWEGTRLVAEYTIGASRMLAYTFTMLPATKQLVIRIRIEDSQNPRAAGPEAKLVYTLSSTTAEE